MTTATLAARGGLGAPGALAAPAEHGGDWPHTTRLLPWLLAAWVAALWLVPFDKIELGVAAPIDPKLDRLIMISIGVVWVVSLLAGGESAPRLRSSKLAWAIGAYALLAVFSVVLNLETLASLEELDMAVKKLALLLSYVAFFLFVSTVLRPAEVPRFVTFIVALASLTAAGIVLEYRTGINVFYDVAHAITPPPFTAGAAPADPLFGRPAVTGPTAHGLAATAILSMALPFAVIKLFGDRTRREKIVYGCAVALILAGAVSTGRKSAAFVPLSAGLVLFAYRPRRAVRLLPVLLVLLLLIQGLSPGALGTLRGQLQPQRLTGGDSYQDRESDYAAVTPDIWKYPLMGRGYGTYDGYKYRILDNHYLGSVIQTGFLGLSLFLGMILAGVAVAHRWIRLNHPSLALPALSAAASMVAFAVAGVFFDIMAFAHAPYVFFLIAGLLGTLGRPE